MTPADALLVERLRALPAEDRELLAKLLRSQKALAEARAWRLLLSSAEEEATRCAELAACPDCDGPPAVLDQVNPVTGTYRSVVLCTYCDCNVEYQTDATIAEAQRGAASLWKIAPRPRPVVAAL